MRRVVVLCLAALCALGTLPNSASAAERTTLVVDDDGRQCAGADFASIQDAVNRAGPGDLVHVCPGRYAEFVVVGKPLTIRGPLDAVEAVDCFNPTPAQLDDLDATQWAIVEPPDPSLSSLFTLAADNIELAGFVIQGLVRPTPTLVGSYTMYTPAVTSSSDHAGYQVHHNLIRKNTFALEFGSSGAAESRAHHNCLRENRWGLANQRELLTAARVDHNQTFRTEQIAYEIGWGYAGTERVTFDHNTSRADQLTYRVENTTATSIDQNAVEAGGRGIGVFGRNAGLEVTDNVLSGGRMGGIIFAPPSLAVPQPTAAPLVRGNTVTGFTGSSGINLMPQANVTGAKIADNAASDNALSGILVGSGNTANAVRSNTADRNGQYGIRTGPGTTGNTIESNQMLGNGLFDALEGTSTVIDGVTVLGNDWITNSCVTDSPPGIICGTP